MAAPLTFVKLNKFNTRVFESKDKKILEQQSCDIQNQLEVVL